MQAAVQVQVQVQVQMQAAVQVQVQARATSSQQQPSELHRAAPALSGALPSGLCGQKVNLS